MAFLKSIGALAISGACACNATGYVFDVSPDSSVNADAVSALGTPRLIAPLTGSVVTSSSPVVRWTGPVSSDAVSVRVQVCASPQCGAAVADFEATGDHATLALGLRGRFFWRVVATDRASAAVSTSATWEFIVAQQTPANAVTGSEQDVNGDGLADAVVGAPAAFDGIGAAYLFVGRAPSPAREATQAWRGEQPGAHFGLTVGAAGDVNGDGFGDVLIGAPDAGAGAGAVYVSFGHVLGSSLTIDQRIESPVGPAGRFGASISAAGDIDGDGFGDIVVGAPDDQSGAVAVYLGSARGLVMAPAVILRDASAVRFGAAVAGLQDTNIDGFADIAIGATGAVYVYRGGSSGIDARAREVLTAPGFAHFGTRVAAAGDIDGDARADLLVASPDEGAVFAIVASTAGFVGSPTIRLAPRPGTTHFDAAIVGGGDLNGDGRADMIVTSPHDGLASIYLGGASTEPAVAILRAATDFGVACAAPGDLTGDGLPDVIIGSPREDSALMYGGALNGTSPAVLWLGADSGGFGSALASLARTRSVLGHRADVPTT